MIVYCLFDKPFSCPYNKVTSKKGEHQMAKVPAFYSVNEVKKPAQNRVYHNDDACPPGRDIPANERRPGTGGYRLCEGCQKR